MDASWLRSLSCRKAIETPAKMNKKIIKLESYSKKKHGMKRKNRMRAFLSRIHQEEEQRNKEEEVVVEESIVAPTVGGVVINEGRRNKNAQEKDIDIGEAKKGKRKMEESKREREARELKEVARVLKRMKMGSSSQSLFRRKRSDQVIAAGLVPNYCEIGKRKAKVTETIDVYTDSTSTNEETETNDDSSTSEDVEEETVFDKEMTSKDEQEDLSDVEFQRVLEEGFKEARTKHKEDKWKNLSNLENKEENEEEKEEMQEDNLEEEEEKKEEEEEMNEGENYKVSMEEDPTKPSFPLDLGINVEPENEHAEIRQ